MVPSALNTEASEPPRGRPVARSVTVPVMSAPGWRTKSIPDVVTPSVTATGVAPTTSVQKVLQGTSSQASSTYPAVLLVFTT